MKFAILPGSLRRDSFNKTLARIVGRQLEQKGHEFDFLNLSEFALPLMNEDLEEAGLPAPVHELDARIKAASALIIVSPEYNGSTPGVLKNAIDWLSRVEKHALKGRPVALLAASPGALGGMRALPITRQVVENLGSFAFPDFFSVQRAHEAYTGEAFTDPKNGERLSKFLDGFIPFAKSLAK